MNVLALVGSLRAGSWTGQVSDAVATLVPNGTAVTRYDLAALPYYDQDLDGDTPPESVLAFRRAIDDADALVVATPEYNGSVTGVLKNAVDWASRPRGAAPLAGKPVAVVSVSPSPRGAQWAREDLVKILKVAGAEPVDDGVGVATVHDVLVDGEIRDTAVRGQLERLVRDLVTAEARPAA